MPPFPCLARAPCIHRVDGQPTNSMPFYRILGDWDEMAPVGDAEVDGAETGKANQQVLLTAVLLYFIHDPLAC